MDGGSEREERWDGERGEKQTGGVGALVPLSSLSSMLSLSLSLSDSSRTSIDVVSGARQQMEADIVGLHQLLGGKGRTGIHPAARRNEMSGGRLRREGRPERERVREREIRRHNGGTEDARERERERNIQRVSIWE